MEGLPCQVIAALPRSRLRGADGTEVSENLGRSGRAIFGRGKGLGSSAAETIGSATSGFDPGGDASFRASLLKLKIPWELKRPSSRLVEIAWKALPAAGGRSTIVKTRNNEKATAIAGIARSTASSIMFFVSFEPEGETLTVG